MATTERMMSPEKVVRLWNRHAPRVLKQVGLRYPRVDVMLIDLAEMGAAAASRWSPTEGAVAFTVGSHVEWCDHPAAHCNDWWSVLLHEVAHGFWAESRTLQIPLALVKSTVAKEAHDWATENTVEAVMSALAHLIPRPEVK